MAVTAVERCCLAASGTRAPLSIRRPATDLASLTPVHASQPRSRPDPVNRAPSRAMRQGLPQRRSGGMAAGWMALISLPHVWSLASASARQRGSIPRWGTRLSTSSRPLSTYAAAPQTLGPSLSLPAIHAPRAYRRRPGDLSCSCSSSLCIPADVPRFLTPLAGLDH
jgi:hypothetical protein